MKSFYLLLSLFLLINFSQAQTIHFVKSDATGANNGSSWADAFNDLQTALSSAASGDQIWIATGTYRPGTTDSATFHITTDLHIYGGFAGTEANLSERDPENNPTILSGDLNEDDILNDFLTNRTDNVRNIMFIDSMVTAAAEVSGLIFAGGQADDTTSNQLYGVRGGGVWSLGAAKFSNCIFRQNYAHLAGGGIHFEDDLCEGAKVMHCIFEDNQAGERGGALASNSVSGSGIGIDSCQFTNNRTERLGGAISFNNMGGAIMNSDFSDNYSSLAAGACFVTNNTADSVSVAVSNCAFEKNESTNAGALGFQSLIGGHDFSVKNCSFLENKVSEFFTGQHNGGGALFFYNFSGGIHASVDSCHFESNTSDNWGGAIVFFDTPNALNNQLNVENTTFLSNTAPYGGAIQTQANGTNLGVNLLNCDFQINQARFGGGGYRSESDDTNFQLTVDSCLFDSNQALVNGGGLELAQLNQGAANLSINASQFLSNTSGNGGAGLNFYSQNSGSATIQINHSSFDGNSNDSTGNAEEGAGGFSLNNVGTGAIDLNFESTVFSNNTSVDGAGAIQLLCSANDEVNLNNSLLAYNSGGEHGGGIGMNGGADLRIMNTTIAENSTGITNTDGSLELQNTILFNPDSTNYIGSGSSAVSSLGGNLIGDASFGSILLPTDQADVDPLFAGSGDFQLRANSPAVDAGLNSGVTAQLDLAGNDRIQGSQVDAGAYESPYTTSIKENLISNPSITIYPNPATEFISIEFENTWSGDVRLEILNAFGQRVYATQFPKAAHDYAGKIEISQLATGTYQLLLSHGQEAMVRRFIKIAN